MAYPKNWNPSPLAWFSATCRYTLLCLGLSLLQITPAAAGKAEDQIRENFKNFLPNMEISEIKPSPSSELYIVRFGGESLYVTKDGRHAFSGDMWDLQTRANLSELGRQELRVVAMSQLSPDEYIEFAPASGYQDVVHVFTDIDCGYCRKLHQHVQEFNRAGIAVRYLAFPRNGMGSQTAKTMETLWCSADKRNAMNQAKQGIPLASTLSCKNPVSKQYALGQSIGVRGTPAVILRDGRSFGYLDPEQLLGLLRGPGQ